MDNPNGINSFPNGLTAFPIGIATGLTGLPPTLGNLITEDQDARHNYDNMDDTKKTELLRNAKDFQSQEELERYLYHLENDDYK
ncbi:MAG: hypothetical protein WCD89_23315 [Anaerocolumna sp.]